MRRKILLKESAKNIVKIRHLLLSFSLVYPKVRIELRIRGTNYKPLVFNPTAEPKEKLAQVFTLQKVANLNKVEVKQFKNWDWSTVLPKVNSANVKHSGATDSKEKIGWDYCLFAVNGRPLNPTFPVTRKIIASINSQLSGILISKSSDGIVSSISPMWVISISSVKSQDFDIHIEPSKDDILFSDLPKVLNIISEFLSQYYQRTPVEKKQEISEESSALQDRYTLMKNITTLSTVPFSQYHDVHNQKSPQSPLLENQKNTPTSSKTLQSKTDNINRSGTPFKQHSITFTAFGAKNQELMPLISLPISFKNESSTSLRLPRQSPVQSTQSQITPPHKKGQYTPTKTNVIRRKNSVSRFGGLVSQYMSPRSSPVSANLARFSSPCVGNYPVRQNQATPQTTTDQIAKSQLSLSPSLVPQTTPAVSRAVVTRSTRVTKPVKKSMLKGQMTIPSMFAKFSGPVKYTRENTNAYWITMESIRRKGHIKFAPSFQGPQNCLASDLLLLLNSRHSSGIYKINPQMTLNGWIILE